MLGSRKEYIGGKSPEISVNKSTFQSRNSRPVWQHEIEGHPDYAHPAPQSSSPFHTLKASLSSWSKMAAPEFQAVRREEAKKDKSRHSSRQVPRSCCSRLSACSHLASRKSGQSCHEAPNNESIALLWEMEKECRRCQYLSKMPWLQTPSFNLACLSIVSVKTLPTDLDNSLLLPGLIMLRGGEGN